jgi:hypothetical protein
VRERVELRVLDEVREGGAEAVARPGVWLPDALSTAMAALAGSVACSSVCRPAPWICSPPASWRMLVAMSTGEPSARVTRHEASAGPPPCSAPAVTLCQMPTSRSPDHLM